MGNEATLVENVRVCGDGYAGAECSCDQSQLSCCPTLITSELHLCLKSWRVYLSTLERIDWPLYEMSNPRSIPVVTRSNWIPSDLSETPGGTVYAMTPGGTTCDS